MPSTVYSVREGARFSASTTLVVVECHTCKIPYAIPESLNNSAIRYPGSRPNGWKLCCPLGHTWYYIGQTEAEKLQERLEYEQRRAGRLAAERDQARAAASTQKGRATRFKNQRDKDRKRVAHGVCPCCGRTFSQLARHMASQHPDFVECADTPQEER